MPSKSEISAQTKALGLILKLALAREMYLDQGSAAFLVSRAKNRNKFFHAPYFIGNLSFKLKFIDTSHFIYLISPLFGVLI